MIAKRISPAAALRQQLEAVQSELARAREENKQLRDTLDKAIMQINGAPALQREIDALMRTNAEACVAYTERVEEAIAADAKAQEELRKLRAERANLIGAIRQRDIVISAMTVAIEATGGIKVERMPT